MRDAFSCVFVCAYLVFYWVGFPGKREGERGRGRGGEGIVRMVHLSYLHQDIAYPTTEYMYGSLFA